MVKKGLLFSIFLLILFFPVIVCGQNSNETLSPIKIGEKTLCDNLSIKIIESPTFTTSTLGLKAENTFLVVKVEIAYKLEEDWNGIDQDSFKLINTSNGKNQIYSLNYAATMMSGISQGFDGLNQKLSFPDRPRYLLFFDAINKRNNWILYFAPHERGKGEAICESIIPLPKIY